MTHLNLETLKNNWDKAALILGSSAASGIPILPNHNIHIQEWGIDDPRTWPICLISIAAIIGLPIFFHLEHEFRHGSRKSNEAPQGKRVSQLEAMRMKVQDNKEDGFHNCPTWTAKNYPEWERLSDADQRSESIIILALEAASIRDSSPKMRKIFLDFVREHPGGQYKDWTDFLATPQRHTHSEYVTEEKHRTDLAGVDDRIDRVGEKADHAARIGTYALEENKKTRRGVTRVSAEMARHKRGH